MSIDITLERSQLVGFLNQEVIDQLGLTYKPSSIYIGVSNIEHIKRKHPTEFDAYLQKIPEIIEHPDYIGKHPKQGGVEFIKRFDKDVMVSVRLSSKGTAYVRSLYMVSEESNKTYLRRGTLRAFSTRLEESSTDVYNQ